MVSVVAWPRTTRVATSPALPSGVPNRPVLIDSFVSLPGTTEIVGLGGVRQPRGEAQEVEVEVVVASDMDAPGFDPVHDVSSHWLGCGQLDLLAPGSCWVGGQWKRWAPGLAIEDSFECNGWREEIGVGLHPQPRGRPFPSRRFASVPGFLLRRLAVEGNAPRERRWNDPDWVLLPPMALLRALFGVSSGFLLELFDGIRDPAVSGERGLVSRQLSRVRDDGTVVLEAGRDLSRDEAVAAAAVIADKAIRSLHDAAFQQLSVDHEARDGRAVNLDLVWPWRVPVRMRLVGRWVTRVDAQPRFVALRIEAIAPPLPFKRVEVRHPGSERGAGRDLPPPDGRTRPANARLVVLTTGRAGSTGRRSVEVPTGSVDLVSARDVEVVSVACGAGVRRDRALIGEDPRDAAPFGTGGRQPGADPEVGAAVLRRRARAGEVAARLPFKALADTWIALETACRSRGWRLDAQPTTSGRRSPHGGLDLTREPLVAIVRVGGRRLVVVDRGSPLGDERSLGLLLPKRGGMSDRDLANAARRACVSVDGSWRSPKVAQPGFAPEFVVRGVARPFGLWDDRAAYADFMRRRIASALAL
ncbi:hypothetical protein GGR88_000617 [Sphingomonas jejuensis]|uniref:Uncharacterized protein n=1 Tax=Sphingomonas jejuensis TaxID=904715 RepID=A0ABX0XJ01_9SPHN|nr:hypothetical protein [Sphingomonas jejuensis]